MSKITEHICDGCGARASAVFARGRTIGLPADWRRLHISHGTRAWRVDVCSPRCAGKAVDATYEAEDRQDVERHGLRALK